MRYVRTLKVFLLSAAMVFFACEIAVALPYYYFEHVKSQYNTFIVARVDSATTVKTPTGATCFYKYDAHLVQKIKGDFNEQNFIFYYEEGLPVGNDYLIYFSDEEARMYNIFGLKNDKREEQSCEQQRQGFVFTYKELHPIVDKDAWFKYVEFNDPFANGAADIDVSHVKDTTRHLVDFKYVEQILAQ